MEGVKAAAAEKKVWRREKKDTKHNFEMSQKAHPELNDD